MALPLAHLSPVQQGDGSGAAVADSFPQQAPAMVREAVVASHGNVKRIRELVDAHPAMARAAYDWGFGDWEDCLGAASHVGNREIAEYLISKGARPTIFSATMLGQLDAVKAFIAAQPGAQWIPDRTASAARARAGGGPPPGGLQLSRRSWRRWGARTEPMSDEEITALVGRYLFGRGAADRFEITVDKGNLMFLRTGMLFGRGLAHLGNKTFHPAGAAALELHSRPWGCDDADRDRRRHCRHRDAADVETAYPWDDVSGSFLGGNRRCRGAGDWMHHSHRDDADDRPARRLLGPFFCGYPTIPGGTRR